MPVVARCLACHRTAAVAASASSRFHEALRDHLTLHHAALLPAASFGNRPPLADVLQHFTITHVRSRFPGGAPDGEPPPRAA